MITNLVIQATNLAFVAFLQRAPEVTGPWTDVQFSYAACPQVHTFTEPTTNGTAFFRVRFLDNGIEPTPENVHAFYWTPTSIAVDATLQFHCDDSQATPTEFWRSYNGAEFELVRTLTSPHFIDINLPPGTYTYKARISGGLFSEIQPSITLP